MFLDLALIPYEIILFDFVLFLIQRENLQYVSTYPSWTYNFLFFFQDCLMAFKAPALHFKVNVKHY